MKIFNRNFEDLAKQYSQRKSFSQSPKNHFSNDLRTSDNSPKSQSCNVIKINVFELNNNLCNTAGVDRIEPKNEENVEDKFNIQSPHSSKIDKFNDIMLQLHRSNQVICDASPAPCLLASEKPVNPSKKLVSTQVPEAPSFQNEDDTKSIHFALCSKHFEEIGFFQYESESCSKYFNI